MKIDKRILSLSIAILVLASLIGTLIWSNHRHSTAFSAPAPAGPVIVSVDPNSVTALTLSVKGADSIKLVKQSDDKWLMTEPTKLAADSDQVAYILQALAPLNAGKVVEPGTSDLRQFGLDRPAIEFDISTSGHPLQRLLIGDDTPIGNSTYAMVAGDTHIYTAAMDIKREFNKTVTNLRDKRLITLGADQMTRIEIIRGGQTIELAHSAAGWTLQKPASYRTDAEAAARLASALGDAEMDSTQPDAKAAEAGFAHGTPVATVKITGPSGTQSIEIRKDGETDYAKSSTVEGVYRVEAPLADAVSKSVTDFRSR